MEKSRLFDLLMEAPAEFVLRTRTSVS